MTWNGKVKYAWHQVTIICYFLILRFFNLQNKIFATVPSSKFISLIFEIGTYNLCILLPSLFLTNKHFYEVDPLMFNLKSTISQVVSIIFQTWMIIQFWHYHFFGFDLCVDETARSKSTVKLPICLKMSNILTNFLFI